MCFVYLEASAGPVETKRPFGVTRVTATPALTCHDRFEQVLRVQIRRPYWSKSSGGRGSVHSLTRGLSRQRGAIGPLHIQHGECNDAQTSSPALVKVK